MTWSVPHPFRPSAALPSLRRRALSLRSPAAPAGPSPITVRCYAGCLLIDIRQGFGPAAEPQIGRLLHAAIRPHNAAVLVSLRGTAELGASGLSALLLARRLAEQQGLNFVLVSDASAPPALPATQTRATRSPRVGDGAGM
ncbi:hypothetical protein GCM10010129_59560 [Streptomyces fumigatiscleroticus]|nr:hypothetical protein GCM10010129_59560 [Streptomyces fumigatiscleroticus]